ncbi:hypothetical protein LTT66_22160 [Nocardia gipuzkoensis]|uniref:hypothetical protein n=1 Tax=Nocardia gipuzkoensis TaxID=2749991 RepID=UPI001E31B69E|nr:hypothetical protein [Nocardia gipuzkoensis]UGT66010.1 hypothetical protein LTT66_22160 [Nocardia gipuzkoensis]
MGQTDMRASTGRWTLRSAGIAGIAVGASLIIGCGAAEVTPTAQPSSPAATTAVPKTCLTVPAAEYQSSDEKELTGKLAKLALPVGTCFFAVDTGDLPGQPGKISVRVDLTIPASTGPEDLRAVATDIAHLVKQDEVAQRTSVLRVTNWGFAKPKYRDHLVDDNFQAHPWDGTPSREAEMALWKVFEQN